MRITDLGWVYLEEASPGPLPIRNLNPGTLWALHRRGLIAPVPPFGLHVVITDEGESLLRRQHAEIAAALIHGAQQ